MARMALLTAIAAGVMSAATLGAASAMKAASPPQSTEWCAVYRNGSENCSLTSQAQCMNNVSGLGGFCRMSYYPVESKRRP